MDIDFRQLAGQMEKFLEVAMKIEPIVMTAASFVPGAKPIVAVVHPVVAMAAPHIEKALEQIAAGNDGDALGAVIELLQHISRGKPNSPVLSAPIGTQALPAGRSESELAVG